MLRRDWNRPARTRERQAKRIDGQRPPDKDQNHDDHKGCRTKPGKGDARYGHTNEEKYQRVGDEGGEIPKRDDKFARIQNQKISFACIQNSKISHQQSGRDGGKHARDMKLLGQQKRTVSCDQRQRRFNQMVGGPPGERDREAATDQSDQRASAGSNYQGLSHLYRRCGFSA